MITMIIHEKQAESISDLLENVKEEDRTAFIKRLIAEGGETVKADGQAHSAVRDTTEDGKLESIGYILSGMFLKAYRAASEE